MYLGHSEKSDRFVKNLLSESLFTKENYPTADDNIYKYIPHKIIGVIVFDIIKDIYCDFPSIILFSLFILRAGSFSEVLGLT